MTEKFVYYLLEGQGVQTLAGHTGTFYKNKVKPHIQEIQAEDMAISTFFDHFKDEENEAMALEVEQEKRHTHKRKLSMGAKEKIYSFVAVGRGQEVTDDLKRNVDKVWGGDIVESDALTLKQHKVYRSTRKALFQKYGKDMIHLEDN